MQQSKQEVQDYQKDEVDLRALAYSLFEKKFLIAGLTGFITILTLIYTTTIPATYKTTSSFTSATSSSIEHINKLIYLDETKNSIFTSFLTSISSEKLQKKAFLENDFLTAFNKNNSPIENIDVFISNILGSIKINLPSLDLNDMAIYLNEKPYSVSFTGSDKEAISRYLNILIEQADKENILDLVRLNKQRTRSRLNEVSMEIISLQNQAKEARLNQIATLRESAKLAKSLGIFENNLRSFKDMNAINIAIDNTIGESDNLPEWYLYGESDNLPEWYLYGEKALVQKIDVLVNRPSDDPYIPELINLKIEKEKLETSELSITDASSINLIISSKVKSITPNTRLIVLLGFIGSFMMSIFLVLFMGAFKPNEKELLPK